TYSKPIFVGGSRWVNLVGKYGYRDEKVSKEAYLGSPRPLEERSAALIPSLQKAFGKFGETRLYKWLIGPAIEEAIFRGLPALIAWGVVSVDPNLALRLIISVNVILGIVFVLLHPRGERGPPIVVAVLSSIAITLPFFGLPIWTLILPLLIHSGVNIWWTYRGERARQSDAPQKPEVEVVPPSAIEKVVLNGKEVKAENVDEKIAGLSKDNYIFNASIEGNELTIGTLPRYFYNEEMQHPYINKPAVNMGVLWGGTSTDGYIMIQVKTFTHRRLYEEEKRKIRNDYVRIARFLVKHGFSEELEFKLHWQTIIFLEESGIFEVSPKTIGELARQPILTRDELDISSC
ncbi:hypothetical protein KA005_68980, partial [bacterium]|nr:hypothetical protein [bacterium]